MSQAALNSVGLAQNQTRAHLEKSLDRLLAVPAMVGIDHMYNALADARGRVRDDHQRQKAILAQVTGIKPPKAEPADGEDMASFHIGDVFIGGADKAAQDGSTSTGTTETGTGTGTSTGTTTGNPNPPPANVPPPGTTPAGGTSTSTTDTKVSTFRERVGSGLKNFVVPALIGGGLLGTGAAGMAIYNGATHRPESVTTITQPGRFEYRYNIETHDTPKDAQ